LEFQQMMVAMTQQMMLVQWLMAEIRHRQQHHQSQRLLNHLPPLLHL